MSGLEIELKEEREHAESLGELANERREHMTKLQEQVEEAEERYAEANWKLGKSLYFERIVKRRKGLVVKLLEALRAKMKANVGAEGRARRAANLQGHGRDESAQAAATHRRLEGRSQGSRGDRQAPSGRHGREGRADERDLARRGARGALEHAGRADSDRSRPISRPRACRTRPATTSITRSSA